MVHLPLQSRKSYTKSKNRSTASKKTKKKGKEEAKDENGANLYPELKNALATIRVEDIQEFGPTLVVCPSSAMMQWRDEIYRCATNGSVKVFLYYQNYRKKIKPRDLLKYDVVLTTYAVLEYDYRRQVNKQKVSCQYCNKLYLPRKLVLHNQYFCGPNSMRTAKQQKTERSRKSALEKAKVTLKITKKKPVTNNKKKRKAKMPTPSAIYKELMEDANREAVPMYVSAKQQKTKDARKKSPPSSTKAEKIRMKEKNNSNTSASITTTNKLVARLQDYTTSGPLDHAPSSLSDSSCGLNNLETTQQGEEEVRELSLKLLRIFQGTEEKQDPVQTIPNQLQVRSK